MHVHRSSSVLAVAAFLAAFVPAASGAATYQIDPVHSSVQFRVKHLGVSNVYGRFNEIRGTIELDPANPSAGSVSFEVPTESVDTHNTQRDNHLRSPDFFDAKQFPTISFASTKVVAVDEDSFDVTGNLTIHGVTKPMTLRVEKTGTGKHPRTGGEMIGFETRTTLERSDYGMSFMIGPVSDEVVVLVAVEASASP